MVDIAKARNQGGNVTEVKVPLYHAGTDTPYDNIVSMPIYNKVKKSDSPTSILGYLNTTDEYADISGMDCIMVTKIANNVMYDNVTVIGMNNASFIVEIDGIEYSVRRAIVRFITGTN